MERWQHIEQIFHDALQLDPTQREAYVREVCRGDSGAFREVSSLLASHGEAGGFEPWAANAAAQLIVERVSLLPGECLGPYRIDSFLSAGGMGEVYRATDTRLNREVAIKVSAARFSEGFETEAKVIASLNHPNICRLYDIGPNYLVMELVEGPTLAERIREGPLPVSEALGVARQIAEALDAAHEKGRVHRDLKPANIKITPEGVVKLLDFGLAEGGGEAFLTGDANSSQTGTIPDSRRGAVLGTPAYMSPEQARGAAVDKRADIWAFGAVVYEMLSGEPAFTGETSSEILEAVLGTDPDFTALPTSTPARIYRLLRWCLQRDCKHRLRDIGDARIAIDTPEEEPVPPRRSWTWLLANSLAIALAGGVAGWWRATRPPPLRPTMRLSIELGSEIPLSNERFQGVLAISPNGRRLVFTSPGRDGIVRLAIRLLDEARSTLLVGTENAQGPFFSSDSEWIGFFADGKLKKISVHGGAPVTLCDAAGPRGASWGDDGNIIAALSLGNRLSRIPGAGGPPTPVPEVSGMKQPIHRWPQVLPGSHSVLFTSDVSGKGPDETMVEILSLETGERKTLERGYFARYLPSGHLVFVREDTLFAAPFDLGHLMVTSAPRPVLDEVSGPAYTGARNFDFSLSGTFVYVCGTAGANQAISWLDSSGHLKPLHPENGRFYQPRFSPDGKRLAFAVATGRGMDIWVQDLDRSAASRRSFLPGRNWWPLWTPDGKAIVFCSFDGSRRAMYWVRADGSGEAQRLAGDDEQGVPRSFYPDGTRLAFDKGNEIWTAPMEGDSEHPRLGAATQLLNAATPVPEAQFSPDGRWMAYVSAELGTADVFVRPFPGPGGRWQISTGGGRFPIWSRNRHELFFLGLDQRIRVTGYATRGNSFSFGTPRVWSEKRVVDLGVNSAYDLAPDGKRCAVILDAEQTAESKPISSITVLVNFFDSLRRLSASGNQTD